MPKKNVPINYFARDYATIKEALVEHAKRYYADTFKDFNEAGFGSLMLDSTAYIGDILSFYLDYNANEGFFDTANEFNNVLRLAKPMGFRLQEYPSSHGIETFFILVPANSTGLGPDPRYVPVLKKGSIVAARNGNNFILNEDVRFDTPSNEVVVGRVDSVTGAPTFYAIRGHGRVISGRYEEITMDVGDFTRFLKLKVDISNIAEIVLVEDSEGHEYFEVDYLSQDVIYRPILNRTRESSEDAKAVLKPFTVPRRFIVERDGRDLYLQFGHGSDASTVAAETIADPANVVLRVHGREYVADETFDPTNLVASDKFGIVPSNTTLRVVARVNTNENVNAGVDTITNVVTPVFEFNDVTSLDAATVRTIRNSLECTNEESIVGDVTLPSTTELKNRVFNTFASQNRAVTSQDYEALVYKMPPEYGAIKRVRVVRDEDSFKRNLNLYVVSEDAEGKLARTNETIKENLKVWLNKNRMINDTIDIIDAKVINLGIDFAVVGDMERNKFDILSDAITALTTEFSRTRDIGEAFFITDVYTALKDVDGVVDVTKVKITQKAGGVYSDIKYNVIENTSPDGRYIHMPKNVIFEIKYPNNDIKGVVK